MPDERSIGASSSAALVIGLCSHGVSTTRALRQSGVRVFAIEKDWTQPGVLTNTVEHIFEVADYQPEQLVPALLEARSQLAAISRVVLLPTNDNHVRIIGEHITALSPHFAVSWAAAAPEVLRLQRKEELERVSTERGLNYPKSAVFRSTADIAAAVAGFRYPMIIKPARPLSSFKTRIASDLAELKALIDTFRADLPILGQEYIAGDDTALYFGALMLDRGRTVHAMVGRKIASHPPARGQTTVAETVDCDQVVALTEQFFAGSSVSGPVSLELKRGPDGSFWVIEPTVGRTDFWAELCIRAGFNQPYMEFQLALGQTPAPAKPLQPCVWYDSERAPLAYAQAAWAARTLRPLGKAQVFPYFGHGDWRPFWRAMASLARRLITRPWG